MTNIKIILKNLEKDYINFKLLEKNFEKINANNNEYINIYKNYQILKKKINDYLKYKLIKQEIKDINLLIESEQTNLEFKTLALNELKILKIQKKNILKKFIFFKNEQQAIIYEKIFLEIRAASGGNEAAIFAEDLFKMYINFFNNKNIKYEIINYHKGNIYGYKEIILKVKGKNIITLLENETGVHRVQRIPVTETNGKIQTSTCTVAVLPELNNINNIEISSTELRIDTFRASGAGGQHVNMTDSAVRIIHLPTNITVECQNERSQHKNKNTALNLLKIKLLQKKKNEQKLSIDEKRKNMIGTGDRSEKIRTYNFIKNRITNHKDNKTIYRLKDIMNGNLDIINTK